MVWIGSFLPKTCFELLWSQQLVLTWIHIFALWIHIIHVTFDLHCRNPDVLTGVLTDFNHRIKTFIGEFYGRLKLNNQCWCEHRLNSVSVCSFIPTSRVSLTLMSFGRNFPTPADLKPAERLLSACSCCVSACCLHVQFLLILLYICCLHCHCVKLSLWQKHITQNNKTVQFMCRWFRISVKSNSGSADFWFCGLDWFQWAVNAPILAELYLVIWGPFNETSKYPQMYSKYMHLIRCGANMVQPLQYRCREGTCVLLHKPECLCINKKSK